MNPRILVTGATGLLGAHLLFELTSSGDEVRAVHRKSSDLLQVRHIFSYYTDDPDKYYKLIEWVEAEVVEIAYLEEAFEGIEEVYHCAALLSFAPQDSQRLIELNPLMTANVVNLCLAKGVKKLVHVSSVAALGRQKQGEPIDEDTEWVESKQNSSYAKSKYLSELEVWRGVEEGLQAAIVNPCIILGPGKWKEGSVALFGRVANGMKFYTEGINAFVDARDVARVMCLLMKSSISGQRFVVSSENRSYKEVFELIARFLEAKAPSTKASKWMGELAWRLEVGRSRLFGGTPLLTRETARTAHQKNFYNSSRICETLNFQFRPLEETIKDIAAFYNLDKGV